MFGLTPSKPPRLPRSPPATGNARNNIAIVTVGEDMLRSGAKIILDVKLYDRRCEDVKQ